MVANVKISISSLFTAKIKLTSSRVKTIFPRHKNFFHNKLSLNNNSLKRFFPVSGHFVNNRFVSQSLLSGYFFLQQGGSLKIQLTVFH